MAEICGIIAGIGTLVLLFKPFFGDGNGFWECVRFWLTPDIFSMFRGEWTKDWLAEMKLGLWFMCGGVVGFAVYTGVSNLN
ncbi:hypothetical protein ACFL54_09250 [Planctomycetota bacterium]